MGGRAAEEVALSVVTGGAKNDIQKATQMARHMVCELGMSDEMGPVQWGTDGDEVFLGRQMSSPSKSYSEDTARRIDLEVKQIVTKAYDSARSILTQNIHVLHSVAQTLMERESLNKEEFAAIVEEAGPIAPEGLMDDGVAQIRLPLLMGVLNVTPDSFSDGGKYTDLPAAGCAGTVDGLEWRGLYRCGR